MRRALIIEDSDWTRRGLASAVPWGELGFTLAGEAADGRAGLELVLSLKPDLVLLDIKMPGLDGLSMLEELRRRQHRGTEFIIISAYNDFTFARRAIVLGARDYLLKPIDQAELIATLRRMADSFERPGGGDRLREFAARGLFAPEFARFLDGAAELEGDRSSSAGYCASRMAERLATNISAYDVASELNISESTLSRQFKKATGCTFGEYLAMVRIRRAMELQLVPGSRVKEIAEQVGIGDPRYFAVMYRRHAGLSPREFHRLVEGRADWRDAAGETDTTGEDS